MRCGVDRGEVGFRPRFVGVDGVWKDFLKGPILIGLRRNVPRPFRSLSPHRGFLALRAAQPLNDKPMYMISYCRTIVRGWVDPREKSDIVPGLSGFQKRA